MDIYNNYEESQGWKDTIFGSYTDSDDHYFKKEMGKVLAASQKQSNFRVLEIGFGNGAFMGWCKAHSIQCDGLEVNAAQIVKAKAAGYVAFANFDEIDQSNDQPKYHAVAGFDVLEHIESQDLINFLTNVKKLCHPGALMVFRFPNGDNPFSLWMQNGDLTHRTFIGSGMITQASIQAGLHIKKIGAPAIPYGNLPIKRRVLVFIGQFLRRLVSVFIVQLFMAGRRNIVLSPNLIVELAND